MKGSAAYPFSNLQTISSFVASSLVEHVPENLVQQASESLLGLVDLPLGGPESLARCSLNLRDNIPEGDEVGIPLEFVLEPADYRIWYDRNNALSPLALWEQVHDIA